MNSLSILYSSNQDRQIEGGGQCIGLAVMAVKGKGNTEL